MENISVALGARSGSVILSPVPMQFWQSVWCEFSVKKGDDETMDLILEGTVEVINVVLQSIQYLGNENFSGNDAIQVSASNMNGKNNLAVPVFVEPINDPPFISVPKFVQLKNEGEDALIFDRARDKFEFSVGDPDLLNFPGRESHFIVKFSMEVDDGFLVTSLPAELINTTEVKLMRSYEWQPLQTYVSISKHFTVKANGVRFRGTLSDCNSVMQQLSYHGEEHSAVLTMKLNDMGHYGCHSSCAEKTSMPLHAEAIVILIRRGPMSSLAAHTLGSAIIIELIVVLCLGVVLLLFTCKCAILLANERKSHKVQDSRPSSVQTCQKKTSSTDLPEDATNFAGCCSSPFVLSCQASNFRQRSRSFLATEESGKDAFSPSQFSAGQNLQPLHSLTPLAIEKKQNEAF